MPLLRFQTVSLWQVLNVYEKAEADPVMCCSWCDARGGNAMWIKRVEWAELLGAKAQVDFLKERLKLAEDMAADGAKLVGKQMTRIAELEAGILDLQDKLNKAQK